MRGFGSRGSLAGHDYDGFDSQKGETGPLITPIKHTRLQEIATRLGLLRNKTGDQALAHAETLIGGKFSERVILKHALRATVGEANKATPNTTSPESETKIQEPSVRLPGEGRV